MKEDADVVVNKEETGERRKINMVINAQQPKRSAQK